MDDVILETMKNNPKNINNFLPSLSKIITKSGLICDFPFIYNKVEYNSKCALFANNKSYCKINVDSNSGINKNKNLADSLLNSDNQLLIIKSEANPKDNEYYDECLSLDETEHYLNELVEENYDFRKKLLIDLYSDIKASIIKTNEEKVMLLYQLSENYCKSKKFDFDCLYDNLILPISHTKKLVDLSKTIISIFQSYKFKLKEMVTKSLKANTILKEYEFIKEENIKIDSRIDSEDVFDYTKLYSDINGKNTISLSLINSKAASSKMSIKSFFKILVTTYQICTEECKTALEYLLVENFGEHLDRIKTETVAYLFHLPNITTSDITSLLLSKSKPFHVVYNNQKYMINNQLDNFLKYKTWTVRYLLAIMYRYLIIEKSFYKDLVLGQLTQVKLNRLLFYPRNEDLNEKQQLQLLRVIPLISSYYTFTSNITSILNNLYNKTRHIEQDVYDKLKNTSDNLNDFRNATNFTISTLGDMNSYLDIKGNGDLIKLDKTLDKIQGIQSKLIDTKQSGSLYNRLNLQSYMNNLEYITKNIYKISYFSQDCHKFLHYHSYFDNISFGTPNLNYINLGYDPYFYLDLDSDIQLFFIYGSLKLDSLIEVNYTITINTNADIDLIINNKLKHDYTIKDNRENTLYDYLKTYTYKYKSPKHKNSYRELVIKGSFNNTGKNSYRKFFEFKIIKQEADTKNSTTSAPEILGISNNKVYEKCSENPQEVTLCFNQHAYNIDCELGCKYLTKNYKSVLAEKEVLRLSEYDIINDKHQKKDNDDPKKFAERNKQKSQRYLNRCEHYCKAFKWNIPIYKCILRNKGLSSIDTVMIKCGGFSNWDLKVRNAKDKWLTNESNKNDILLGKQFYIDNKSFKIKFEHIPYILPSILRPLSNINFILNFDYDKITDYMFTSGDMKYFSVIDKTEPFIKGFPHTAYSPYNNKLFSNLNKNKDDNYIISIINPLYNSDIVNNNGVLLYNDLYNFTNITENKLLFTDNDKYKLNSNSLLKYNDGANVFIRKNSICINKLFFTSNLISKQFYTENTLVTNYIFAFANSNFLLYKIPQELDKNVILLKTKNYQTNYIINVINHSRVYISLEISSYIEFNALQLMNDGWSFLKGSDKMIELLTADIGEDILKKQGEFNYYDCQFNSNLNPNCQNLSNDNMGKIKMNIFYKDLKPGNHVIKYSFFDFDDLYSSLHLIMIKPLVCNRDKSYYYAYKDKVNNNMKLKTEYLPTYDSDLENFQKKIIENDVDIIRKERQKLIDVNLINNNTVSNTNNTKSTEKVKLYPTIKCENEGKKKKYTDFLSFLQLGDYNYQNNSELLLYNIGDNQYNILSSKQKFEKKLKSLEIDPNYNHTEYVNKDYYLHQEYVSRNYSNPLIKSNQNGCTFALDRFGSLFFKTIDTKSNNTTWTEIKNNVRQFELNENIIITLDFDGVLQMQKGITQNNKCLIHTNWIQMKYQISSKINKISLSSYSCLWMLDNKNNIYTGNNINYYLNENIQVYFTKVETYINGPIKYISQYNDKLYLLTRDKDIYIKNNTYDNIHSSCIQGEKPVYLSDLSTTNSNNLSSKYNTEIHNINIKLIKENKSGIVILDYDGNLYYRSYMNEITDLGQSWEKLDVIKTDEFSKIVDFHLGFKDIHTINANGKIITLEDINRPRIYDV